MCVCFQTLNKGVNAVCCVMQVGVTPLADNDPRDRYLYELVVYTGSAKAASTRSKVQVRHHTTLRIKSHKGTT